MIGLRNPTPGHTPEENHNSKRYMYSMFTAALFTIVRTWKQPKCLSTGERIKIWYMHTMELLLNHKIVCNLNVKN